MIAVGAWIDHDEPAASCVVLANERQARGRLIVPFNDDVLEELAETRFDGSLVSAVDLEIIGHRALLPDVAVGLHQHHPGGVAELPARGDKLFERGQPRLDAGQVLLARADTPRARLVFAPRGGQHRFLRHSPGSDRVERLVRAAQCRGGGTAVGLDLLNFDEDVRFLDLELAERFANAIALRRRVFHRMTQRGQGIQNRVDLRPRPVDVALDRLDALLRAGVRLARFGEHGGRLVSRPFRVRTRRLARLDGNPRGLAPRLQILDLVRDLGRARAERRSLMTIELQLLLPPVDLELRGMRPLANRRRALIRFGLFDAQAAQVRFHFRDARSRRRLALARVGQVRPRRLDAVSQLAVAAGKQHFLPSPQLLAQPLVSPRLGGLPLQHAALLFDFENDVVDAGEILLGGLELQLRGAASGLVLGDARRLLDQLPPVDRTRAEDHPDLPLLDEA